MLIVVPPPLSAESPPPRPAIMPGVVLVAVEQCVGNPNENTSQRITAMKAMTERGEGGDSPKG